MSVLNFSIATVTANNLGGRGPDSGAEEIRYQGITNAGNEADGGPVDLVITELSGEYHCKICTNNGISGDFGMINMARNPSAELKFQFERSGTYEPVTSILSCCTLHPPGEKI